MGEISLCLKDSLRFLAFFGASKPLRFEADARDLEIIGEIPAAFRGTFYRTGPVHQFPIRADDYVVNGDGLASVFRIDDGHVDLSCRYVRTQRFDMERKGRRCLYGAYRNPFADDASTAGTDRDNTANTNAIVHAGRLFALREDSLLTKLNPDTLATKGTWDFDGKLQSTAVTAHPKFDPKTGEWWSMFVLLGRRRASGYLPAGD